MLKVFILIILIISLNIVLFKFNNYISNVLNLFDYPDKKRKLHENPTPLNGGIFFFLNILFILSYDNFFNNNLINSYLRFNHEFQIIFFIIICFSLLGIGIVDDKLSLKPITKTGLSIFLFSLFLLINENYIIDELRFKELDKVLDLFNISFLFTIICFAVLQIAFNMYDGINLQSSSYYSILILYIFIITENFGLRLFCTLILLYLIFFSINNYKKKIFLGDNGVFIFSFIISILIINVYNNNSVLYVENILILFLLPFLDLIRLFLLRLKINRNPFIGDRNHIHHILLEKYSYLKTIILLNLPIIISVFLIYKTDFGLWLILTVKFIYYSFLIKKKYD